MKAARRKIDPAEAFGTQERILDAAEELFSLHGPDGASLREITAKAEVNLGAVNYHFRSKEALFLAVFARRIKPLNEARLAWLDRLEAKAAGKPLAVEQILEVLVRPVLEAAFDESLGGHRFLRLLGRSLVAPGEVMAPLIKQEFEPLIARFFAAFSKALPNLPKPELWWRMHLTVGTMLHAAYHQHNVEVASKGLCKARDVESAVRHLIEFTAAGLRAPLGVRAKKKSR